MAVQRSLGLCAAALAIFGSGAAHTASENDLKAAVLLNLARFVEWPPGAADVPFCIGLAGRRPFYGALEEAVVRQAIGGRAIVVRRIGEGRAARCEMVFIAGTNLDKVRAQLAYFRGFSVLTVGEAPGFCRAGGVVEFSVQGSKPKLAINLDAAQRAHLQISSQLLGLASVVRDSD